MVEVRLSTAARSDLAAVDAYSARQFGDDVADAYARGFLEAFDLLARHPQSGAPRPELGEEIRCLVHRRHRIFYRFGDDIVLIVRILHHAMDERAAQLGRP
ncbi:type II toxin-antitoxin system RelE/ParE family toxin [Novosphingobium sp. 9]|uniref:type II toxin-antitoxin system RelE/ParE family toxin n=1 Tax=Novosphingobium sp. 9 TaxID=2025349 RepID=UPI00391F4C9A